MALIENFISRGLEIRLLNVKLEVRSIIGMANKESFFQMIYNEKDGAKAVSLFEKEIREKKILSGDGHLKKRHHTRVNTFFPSEFKVRTNHGTTLGSANILNLSECGVLAGQIIIMHTNTEEIDNCWGMAEQEIYDLKFKLNGDKTSITTQGRCVRAFMNRESLYAGIRFEDLSYQQREIICSFVYAHK